MDSKKSKRKGLILAAGYGSRLEGTSAIAGFKPLIPILGVPLIFQTIDSLSKAGCDEILIVLGYGHKEVKNAILESYEGKIPLKFMYNEKYDLGNGVSVLSAKDYVGEVFVMTMADHVLGDSLMQIACDFEPEEDSAALLVDYKIDTIFDMEDATKVLSKDGKIVSIGKQIEEFNCIDTGVFICTHGLIRSLEKYYARHGDASISNGVQYLADSGKMFTIDIGDGFWQDVDTPETLEYIEGTLAKNATNKLK